MALSSNNHKDTSNPRHRSHKGCWTCKRKRIQCDETRPGCQRCTERGLTCEGYRIRLRWGAGIASRGRFSGAEKPTQESIPPPSKRRWDLRTKDEQREGDQQGQPVLLLGHTEVRSLNLLSQPVNKRPTVNILNTPYGQDANEYMGIIKHFEIPVSVGMGGERVEAFNGKQTLSQYGEGISGRSAIIA